MNARNLYGAVLSLLFITYLMLFCPNLTNADEPLWSKEARSITSLEKVEIPSPGHGKIAVIDNLNLYVMANGRKLPSVDDKGVAPPAELLWSPDAEAFVITETDGGLVGTWYANVYLIKNATLKYLDISQKIILEFKKHYKCVTPEEPNIGAIKWLDGSKKLLLVAEVPPHSSCLEMGKLKGYIVEVSTGKIVKEIEEEALKAKWDQYLGKRISR